MARCQAPTYDSSNVDTFTDGILLFWRTHGGNFPAWAEAARIVFAMLPNSAMSERVFARVKNLFGSDQLSALSDMIQVALMLNENERK